MNTKIDINKKYQYRAPRFGKKLIALWPLKSGGFASERRDGIIMKHNESGVVQNGQGDRHHAYDLVEVVDTQCKDCGGDVETGHQRLCQTTVGKEPLRLEAGHYYKNRRGEVVGPIGPKSNNGQFPFWEDTYGSYTEDGLWHGKGFPSDLDLITEHIAPQSEEDSTVAAIPATPAFPAVGTRLRFTKQIGVWQIGEAIQFVCHNTDETSDGKSFKAKDDKGVLWEHFHIRYLVDGTLEPLPTPPVRPGGIPAENEGYIYYGIGPVANNTVGFNSDLIGITNPYEKWDNGPLYGNTKNVHYALRRGSAIHRAQPWFHESQVVAGNHYDSAEIVTNEEKSSKTVTTYPPDESEWQDMVSAPRDGTVVELRSETPVKGHFADRAGHPGGGPDYRNVWVDEENGYPMDEPTGWRPIDESEAVPAPQWRELGGDDSLWNGEAYTDDKGATWRNLGPKAIIQSGDYISVGKLESSWVSACTTLGSTVQSNIDRDSRFRARRRIQAPVVVNETPISESESALNRIAEFVGMAGGTPNYTAASIVSLIENLTSKVSYQDARHCWESTSALYKLAAARNWKHFMKEHPSPDPVVEADPWRDMLPKEVIEDGDEVSSGFINAEWLEASTTVLRGTSVEDCRHTNKRFTARTRRPLVTVDPVSGVNVPVRYYHSTRFLDGTQYLEWDGELMWLISGNGTRKRALAYDFEDCELKVREGVWTKEAPADERKASGVEARVCEDIAARQAVGIAKYGTTVEANPLPLREWLEHAYQESLDLPIYLKRAMEQIDEKSKTPEEAP